MVKKVGLVACEKCDCCKSWIKTLGRVIDQQKQIIDILMEQAEKAK